MISLKPKDDFFFEQFIRAADNCHKSAIALHDLVNNYTNIEEKVKKIEELEHEGDAISHQIIANLKKAFITPIDREDIYKITNKLDTVVDYIQASAFRFDMLNIKTITDEMKTLCDSILKSTEKLPLLMESLKNIQSKNRNNIIQIIIDINNIEDESDDIFRDAVRNLFRSDFENIQKVTIKEVYEYLEQVIDCVEDVADKVEEVVMKNA